MGIDHSKRLVSMIIAVCVLVLLGFGAGAADRPPTVDQAGQAGSAKTGGTERSTRVAPQATLPATWQVPYVHESNGVNGAYCSTAVVVLNPLATLVNGGDWEVEWLDDLGNSLAFENAIYLCPRCRFTIIADNEVTPFWSVVDMDHNLGNFTGSVTVHGDPRLVVSAYEWCRSAAGPGGALVAVNDVAAYPVGAALAYFQAGMPATWTPPMAEPELPE